MAQGMYSDMVVAGLGTFDGGVYDKVRIDGVAFVKGDVQCDRFICNGSGKLNGSVSAHSMDVNGLASFGSHVQAQQIKVCGKANIDGDLLGEELRVDGSVSVSTNCEMHSIDVHGRLSVDRDIRATRFNTNGSFRAGNQVLAEYVRIELNGHCEARELRAKQIEAVRGYVKKNSFLGAMFQAFGQQPLLEAQLIEGDSIRLEQTHASLVRGRQVSIGPGSQISRVEYSQEIYIDPTAIVHECVQI